MQNWLFNKIIRKNAIYGANRYIRTRSFSLLSTLLVYFGLYVKVSVSNINNNTFILHSAILGMTVNVAFPFAVTSNCESFSVSSATSLWNCLNF